MQWISCIQRLKSKKNSKFYFPVGNVWTVHIIFDSYSEDCDNILALCVMPRSYEKKKNSDWWSFCKILYVLFVKKERKITIWENKNPIVPTKKKLYPIYTGKYLTLCTCWYIESTQQLFVEWKNPISFALFCFFKKKKAAIFCKEQKLYYFTLHSGKK